jgi:hypothetical protein
VFNSVLVTDNSENIYYSKSVSKSQNIFYSKYIDASFDIWFSSNLIGCQHCAFCDNMVNSTYCIENTQYTKEEYEAKIKQILADKIQFQHNVSQVNNLALSFQSENST